MKKAKLKEIFQKAVNNNSFTGVSEELKQAKQHKNDLISVLTLASFFDELNSGRN